MARDYGPRREPPNFYPMHGRNWKSRFKKKCRVWEKTGGYCWHCFEALNWDRYHMDHVVPKSLGGRHSIDNLMPACEHCNLSRNNKLNWHPERIMPRAAV